jgi:tetratricopeptide (TPR) repeat protein
MERDYAEIRLIQSALSLAIVSGIKVAVTPEEKTILAVKQKVNPDAYDMYLRGRERYRSPFGKETILSVFLETLDYFQKAIDIDPSLAQAQAWKSHLLNQLGAEGFMDEKVAYPKAMEAALKAVALDNNLSDAHRSLGLIKMDMDWDFRAAELELKKALDLNPGDGLSELLYLRILGCVGKTDEAVALFERRIERDTKKYGRRRYSTQNALDFFCFGRYKEGLDEQMKVVGNDPEEQWPHIAWLAVAYALNSMHSDALEQINRIKDQAGPLKDEYFLRNYAWILGICGWREEALSKLEELRALLDEKNIDSAYYTACVYAGMGDNDKAFEYLDRAFTSHSGQITWLLIDFWLHPLHSDPRFDALRKKMGL